MRIMRLSLGVKTLFIETGSSGSRGYLRQLKPNSLEKAPSVYETAFSFHTTTLYLGKELTKLPIGQKLGSREFTDSSTSINAPK
jgi:hypothetical protein